VYTPGSVAGSYSVTASIAGTNLSQSVPVNIVAVTSPIVSLSVSPSSANVSTGGTQQFTATATRQDGSTLVPSVTWSATGGSITGGGLYTAGTTAGAFRVIAVQQGGSLADTSTVNIATPVLQAVILSPSTANVVTGGTRQFSVTGQWSNGATTAPSVTYTATGGSITAGGLYTAGSTTGSFRVIATQQGGTLADTSTVTISAAPPAGMYFNSSEPGGGGSNSNILLADDFERGNWYTMDYDQAMASGGLLQVYGWGGTIYANPISPSGAAVAGGVRGTGYTATHGVVTGGSGGRNMAAHNLSQDVTEVYVRYYTRFRTGYQFGAEKFLTVDRRDDWGGIFFGNLHINMGGDRQSTGRLFWQSPGSEDTSRNLGYTFNGNGHWYFVELHIKLGTSSSSNNGVLEVWVDDVGVDGFGGPSSPTLRYSVTNYNFPTGQIGQLWWENWANPGSIGQRDIDQIMVSKVGPIGYMQ
jgi:hypothetical protein